MSTDAVAGTPSLRERQKAQTRDHLLAVATRLFAERGFSETTMEDIASAAGAARATVYAYFPTKDQIVVELTTAMWDDAEELYAEFGAIDRWTPASIRGWLENAIAVWQASVQRILVVLGRARAHVSEEIVVRRERYVDELTRNESLWSHFGKEERRVRATLLIVQLEAFLGLWIAQEWEADHDRVLDTLTEVWLTTLQPQRSRK